MSLTKYNQTSWTSTLCSNIKSTQYLHTHNPNYISKPPLQIYSTQSKQHYNPRESIDRDIIWRSSSKKVPLTKSQDYIFRSASKKVDDYHKRNDSGNIISHQFIKASKEKDVKMRGHPAVEKRKQIRSGKERKEEMMSRTTTTETNIQEKRSNNERPNYMNSKLMRQTLQYEFAPNQEKKTYMPKTLRNK